MELLWAMSDGSKSDMDRWGTTLVGEFFMGLWVHQEKIEKVLEKMNQQE